MAQALRLIVFNADEDFGPVLRGELLSFDGVKIVAEVDEPALLMEAVQRFSVELVVVHLDPFPDAIIQLVKELHANRPDLTCFGVSGSNDSAVILAAMRAGFSEFLTKPLHRADIENALNKKAAQQPASHHHGRLISVISTVGGVGASTIAVNLGAELAQQDAGRVALVDLDFRFGQVATYLDLQPTFSIADLCDTPEQLDPQMIEKAVIKHSTGVEVLARPQHLAQAEQISAAHTASALSSLQDFFDILIADGPTRYDSGGRTVLEMSDTVLLVLQLTVPSVRNADRIMQELARQGYNLDRIKLVCNHVDAEGALAVEQVETTLNQKVFATIAHDPKAVTTGVNMGEPLCIAAARSKSRLDIEVLARRLSPAAPDADGSDVPKAGAGGLFSRIFSAAK